MTSCGLREEQTKSRSFTISLPRRKLPPVAILDDVLMIAQRLADFLRLRPRVGVDIKRRVVAGLRDTGQQFLLRLRAKTGEVADLVREARGLKVRHAGNAELLVQHLDFLRAERGNFHHGKQARRHRLAEFLVVFEAICLDQLGNFLLQSIADAGGARRAAFLSPARRYRPQNYRALGRHWCRRGP